MPRNRSQYAKDESDESTEELLNALKELGITLGPMFLKNKELDAPIIRRQQWMNFSIMITICIGVVLLAYSRVIDGSAATGLIGAVVGYVFGHIYSRGDKR